MMKGKPQGGVPGTVASSTLAYPGNSFKYSPNLPTKDPQHRLSVSDLTTTTVLLSGAAKSPSSVSSSGPIQRHSRPPSQICDEIQSVSEEDTFGSDHSNQELQTKKVVVEVLQKAASKKVKNGPKIYQN